MTGWVCYIDDLAYWYVYLFEQKDCLTLTAYPMELTDAMSMDLSKQGQEVNFSLKKICGDTFAKIERI